MIKESTEKLMQLNDMEWGKYIFSRDPLNRKVNPKQRMDMIRNAMQCGKEKAAELRKQFGNLSVSDYAKKLDLKISFEDSYGSENYIVFARFNYPDKVTIYKGNVDKVNKLILEHDMQDMMEHVIVENVLLAHEMFHFLEEKDNFIYTRTEKIELWKIGPFHYQSKLMAIGEIAAMAFARELNGISYNPYLFDAIMLYPHDKEKTQKLVDEILQMKEN